jgi:uncharacterized protein YndB with AHSA1/START domain
MDEASIDIDAPAATVYDLVADLTAMGRWSPETHRVEWLDGATAAAPGARFKGWNRAKIGPVPLRWSTTCVVRQADPGRVLAFDTITSGARWTYRFDPRGDGACRVTETRELLRSPLHTKVLDAAIGPLRQRQLVEGMRTTLGRLKVAAEAAAPQRP